MQRVAIMDVILPAVVLLFAALGARRGLWRSLAGLLTLTLAILGASVLTEICAEGVEEVLRPAVTERMETVVSEAMEERAAEEIAQAESIRAVEELLHRLGWKGELSESVRESTETLLEGVESAVTAALVDTVLPTVVTAGLRAVFFAVLLVLLRLCERMLRPVLGQLPLLRTCDRLLGAAAGAAQGALVVYVLLWLLRCLGAAEGTESFFLSLFIR